MRLAIIASVLVLAALVIHDAALPVATPQPATALCSQDPLPSIALEARAVYAYDVATGQVLYAKDSDTQYPLASLTKLMTVAVALSSLGESTAVTIRDSATTGEGDVLSVGSEWLSGPLARATLVASLNQGARALAEAASYGAKDERGSFHERMNALARTEGLSTLYFIDETGLDVNAHTAGAYGSARDVAHLTAYVHEKYPHIFDSSTLPFITIATTDGAVQTFANTSPTASKLPGSSVSKTGYTDLAGGNLVILYEPIVGHPVAISVLGSTREGRNTDVEKLTALIEPALKRAMLCTSTL